MQFLSCIVRTSVDSPVVVEIPGALRFITEQTHRGPPARRGLRKMTSLSNQRYGSAWIEKVFQMTNQEFQAQGAKYQVLPNLGICSGELVRSKLQVFRHACAISALSSPPV